jgi:hypothetical protein
MVLRSAMNIIIEPHTLIRAEERGTNNIEIIDVINTGYEAQAKNNRKCKFKVYEFNQERNGKIYKQKRVEVFYLIENEIIITVTVYVYYGNWEV